MTLNASQASPRRILSSNSLLISNTTSLMNSPGGHSSVALGQSIVTPEIKSNKYEITKKDRRQYVCQKWIVDPKIHFIDRFKWNPPVVDDILKKLQVNI